MTTELSNQLVESTIADILRASSGMDSSKLDRKATFLELGFDSLFLIQFSQGIKKKLGVKVSFRQMIEEFSSLELLIDYIAEKLPEDRVPSPPAILPSTPADASVARSTTNPAMQKTSTAIPGPQIEATAQIQPLGLPTLSEPVMGSGDSPQGLEQVITQQNQLMALQLQLLSGQPRPVIDETQTPVADTSAPAAHSSLNTVDQQSPASSSPAVVVTQTTEEDKNRRFGPYKPVRSAHGGQLSDLQQKHIEELVDRLTRKTKKSQTHAQQHRPHFADPRGVAAYRRIWKSMVYQISAEKSQGSKLWDLDGNEYIDIAMGFGLNLFGHSPSFITNALQTQLTRGVEVGPQAPLAGEVAQLLCDMTGAERATFCNTGSEAVMGAIRLARTVTGKSKVVFFNKDYHGNFDEVLLRCNNVAGQWRTSPAAPGVPDSLLEDVIVLPYGEPESIEFIRRNADELAAVLVEPVQSANPFLQPRDFLHEVRQITTDNDVAMIMDEMITGFRTTQGGAQQYFDVWGDLATYGKVLGGGLPIGAIVGSARFMDALDGGMWRYEDDSEPVADMTFFAGTFVRHPLAMVAAHQVLMKLKEEGPELQEDLNAKTQRLVDRLNHFFETEVYPIRVATFSSQFRMMFPSDLEYADLLYFHLLERGIFMRGWEDNCFLSTAHSDDDIERILEAIKDSCRHLRAGGFMPEPEPTSMAATTSDPQQPEPPNDAVPPGSDEQFSLAEGQREMWLGAQMSPEAAGPHHACNALLLEGPFNLAAMQEAIATVIDRHEGLRCRFHPDGSSVIVQPNFVLDVPIVDLTDLRQLEQRARVAEIMSVEGKRLFDLSNGPLIAAQILKLSETSHQLIFTAQMIVCDGWSHFVVFEEIGEIYSAICEGRDPVLGDVVPMREFAQWQRDYWNSDEGKDCEEHWLSKFQTTPAPLDLPTIGPRPASRTICADRVERQLSGEAYNAIKAFGRKHGSSSFSVLLSAFQVWLHRLSGAKDLVVGVPFSEQGSLGFETLVGQCANTLPIRAQLDPEEDFSELLSRTGDSLLDAQENAHYTFGKLIPHLNLPNDPSRIPLVSVLFNIDPAMDEVKFSDINHTFTGGPRVYFQFDLGFNLVEKSEGLLIECDFNTNLFDPEIVEDWLSGYEILLQSILAEENRSLAQLPMVNQIPVVNQARDAATTSSATDAGLTATLCELIEEQIRRTPDSDAVRDDAGSVSYRELDGRANYLANKLRQVHKHSQTKIGIFVDRTSDMVVALLAVLKSGGCFVPIDPNLPKDQIDAIIEDAELAAVIAHDLLGQRLGELDIPLVSPNDLTTTTASCPPGNVDVPHDQLAYITYIFSGTNNPIKVEITNQAIVNFLLSMQREPGINESDKVLGLSSFSTDVALAELLLPLTVGAQCVIVPHEIAADSRLLSDWIVDKEITLLQATPTTLRSLLRCGWQGSAGLKVLVGGERVSGELADRLHGCCGELWHMYGHTEAAIWTSAKKLKPDSTPTLGNPIAHTTLRIVDDHLQPVPTGVAGEIRISGLRTGDFARRLPCGELEFLGQKDWRVSIRGQQIDLANIESLLREHAKISDAAVAVRDDLPDQPRLVAYLVAKENMRSTETQRQFTREIRQLMRGKLPAYMLPERFVYLDELPTTIAAKLDRSRLPSPPENDDDLSDQYVPPTTRTQETLVEIWKNVLSLPQVGIEDHFFELGGQSLLAVKLFARIESELGRKLPLSTLFEAPTIQGLSGILDRAPEADRGWPSLVPIQPQGKKKPLFVVHGAGGNVLLYQAVAKHLAPEYPLYGLQSQGLDGESEPLHTVEEMAERYVREVRSVQPEGPYYLGGYCLGGTVAYEMAQRLLREGEDVAIVAMLDTYNFSRALKSSFLGFLTQKIRFHLGNFIRLRPRHMGAYLKEKIRVARDGELANLRTSRPVFNVEEEAGRATSGAELTVQKINDFAAETYIPKPYPGTLTVFKPRINYKFYPDPKMGWGELASLDIVEFPFNPHAMLVEPYVEQLAAALIQSMNAATPSDPPAWESEDSESLSSTEPRDLVLVAQCASDESDDPTRLN